MQIRKLRCGEILALVRLFSAVVARDGNGFCAHREVRTPREVRTYLSLLDPRYEECVLVAEERGTLGGFAGVFGRRGRGRILGPAVHPAFRRQGLGAELLAGALALAREGGVRRVVCCGDAADRVSFHLLVEVFGFVPCHATVEMRVALGQARPGLAGTSPGVEIGALSRSDPEDYLTVYNRCFPSSWLSGDEMETLRRMPDFDPETVWLARVDGVPVGLCDLGLGRGGRAGGDSRCRLYVLGVAPDYRGRGIGGALLDMALCAARGRGARHMALSVGADNGPAVSMYRARGFVEVARATWYEKLLD